ncbi:protein TSSC4 [Anoplophora glabripennis]|uniref:protein TSSC4 n=1 Tax=Anoplophora glabripennis TaxID=217634 RepID=UPI0008749332|nr:protein TSSC4 [Anoplophora glabripennis]
MSNPSNSFSLKVTNADFAERQKNVFDQLKVLENSRKNTGNHNSVETEEQVDPNRRNQRSITKHFRGKESIFKKPQNVAPKNYINRIPDFKKNPHKWTRYSLDDVREEDISDKGNTKAALSFLKELEERKSQEMDCDQEQVDQPVKKIIFKKHTSTVIGPKDDENPDTCKPSFRSSKVVMPEYVVGQKMKKEKKNKSLKAGKGKELKLDHLFESEENE